MLYFVAASHNDALPVIKEYNMKKRTDIDKFQMFEGAYASLFITGTGFVNIISAVSYICGKFCLSENDFIIHIGIWNHSIEGLKSGNILLCNKLTDNISGRDFYPDMILSHPFAEKALIDSESAFFWQTAVHFLPSHKIYVFKVILEYSEITVSLIKNWLNKAQAVKSTEQLSFTDNEQELIKIICRNLRFTISMEREFLERLVKIKLRTETNLETLLKSYERVEASTRAQSKSVLADFKKLSQPLV